MVICIIWLIFMTADIEAHYTEWARCAFQRTITLTYLNAMIVCEFVCTF